jgi:type IV pilus assembly protein PilV
MPSLNSNRGFSLMECLIALFVLSVGLLGSSKMVGYSLQFTDTALIRTQSVTLAYALADRIRANHINFDGYDIDFAEVVAGPPDCAANPCSGANLVLADLADWKNQVAVMLPSGDGQSVITADNATVTVSWNDRGQAGNFSLVVTR